MSGLQCRHSPDEASLAFCSNLAQAVSFDSLRRAKSRKVALARAAYEWSIEAKTVSSQKLIHSTIC